MYPSDFLTWKKRWILCRDSTRKRHDGSKNKSANNLDTSADLQAQSSCLSWPRWQPQECRTTGGSGLCQDLPSSVCQSGPTSCGQQPKLWVKLEPAFVWTNLSGSLWRPRQWWPSRTWWWSAHSSSQVLTRLVLGPRQRRCTSRCGFFPVQWWRQSDVNALNFN